jgi:uncharacterized YkwD family protein
MRKFKALISAVVILLMIISILGGCTYEPARRYIQTDPNDTAAPNTPMMPNNLVGQSTNNGEQLISATHENVDFSYLTITGDNCRARTGAGGNYPAVATLKSGEKIRALGKLDGWYVIKLPDSGKIACIPAEKANPVSTGTASPTPITGNTGKAGASNNAAGTGNKGAANNAAAGGSGTMTSDEARILQLVNAERAKAGEKPLASNSDCTKLARMKSKDMVDNNYFSHQSPTYGSPFDMLKANNVSYMYAGENIAMNQSADAAFKAWMNSEGHKKNILNPNFTELGVGIIPKGNGSYIYTQIFIGK